MVKIRKKQWKHTVCAPLSCSSHLLPYTVLLVLFTRNPGAEALMFVASIYGPYLRLPSEIHHKITPEGDIEGEARLMAAATSCGL